MQRQEVGYVREALRKRRYLIERLPRCCHIQPAQPLRDNFFYFAIRHSRHRNLNKCTLNRLMFANQFVHRIGNADENNRRANTVIGERFNCISHKGRNMSVTDTVKLVKYRNQNHTATKLIECATYVVGAKLFGKVPYDAFTDLDLSRVETDIHLRFSDDDVLELLFPKRGKRVRDIAVNSGYEKALT